MGRRGMAGLVGGRQWVVEMSRGPVESVGGVVDEVELRTKRSESFTLNSAAAALIDQRPGKWHRSAMCDRKDGARMAPEHGTKLAQALPVLRWTLAG